jgi:hypothetical protein
VEEEGCPILGEELTGRKMRVRGGYEAGIKSAGFAKWEVGWHLGRGRGLEVVSTSRVKWG